MRAGLIILLITTHLASTAFAPDLGAIVTGFAKVLQSGDLAAAGKTVKAERLKNEGMAEISQQIQLGRKITAAKPCYFFRVGYSYETEFRLSCAPRTTVKSGAVIDAISFQLAKNSPADKLEVFEDLDYGQRFFGEVVIVDNEPEYKEFSWHTPKLFDLDEFAETPQVVIYVRIVKIVPGEAQDTPR